MLTALVYNFIGKNKEQKPKPLSNHTVFLYDVTAKKNAQRTDHMINTIAGEEQVSFKKLVENFESAEFPPFYSQTAAFLILL